MKAEEILRKKEDENEYHFHPSDRKFILEAMEEYAESRPQHKEIVWEKAKEAFEEWFDGDAFNATYHQIFYFLQNVYNK